MTTLTGLFMKTTPIYNSHKSTSASTVHHEFFRVQSKTSSVNAFPDADRKTYLAAIYYTYPPPLAARSRCQRAVMTGLGSNAQITFCVSLLENGHQPETIPLGNQTNP